MVDSSWLFFLGRAFFRLFFYTLWRLRVYGHKHIPSDGGVIIAPNHTSYADPPLTGSAMSRPLYFMAKKELFDMPLLGFLIRRTHAFPVQRGKQDMGAFRTVIRLLKSGKPVLVFPEGTRSRDGNLGKARAGIGMIACLAQVPVVPVYIENANKLGAFLPLTVTFGNPLSPPVEYDKEAYQSFAEKIVEEIKRISHGNEN